MGDEAGTGFSSSPTKLCTNTYLSAKSDAPAFTRLFLKHLEPTTGRVQKCATSYVPVHAISQPAISPNGPSSEVCNVLRANAGLHAVDLPTIVFNKAHHEFLGNPNRAFLVSPTRKRGFMPTLTCASFRTRCGCTTNPLLQWGQSASALEYLMQFYIT